MELIKSMLKLILLIILDISSNFHELISGTFEPNPKWQFELDRAERRVL
jgi:hypothetical protein